MKGDPSVITSLRAAAVLEASLAAQYCLDARDLKHFGAKSLKRKIDGFGKECEEWLEDILDRILFLGGDPGYSTDATESAGSVSEMLQRALDAETGLRDQYQEWCVAAAPIDDNTRNIYEHLIKWHEDDHIDWLEKQLAQIEKFGEDEWLLEHS